MSKIKIRLRPEAIINRTPPKVDAFSMEVHHRLLELRRIKAAVELGAQVLEVEPPAVGSAVYLDSHDVWIEGSCYERVSAEVEYLFQLSDDGGVEFVAAQYDDHTHYSLYRLAALREVGPKCYFRAGSQQQGVTFDRGLAELLVQGASKKGAIGITWELGPADAALTISQTELMRLAQYTYECTAWHTRRLARRYVFPSPTPSQPTEELAPKRAC